MIIRCFIPVPAEDYRPYQKDFREEIRGSWSFNSMDEFEQEIRKHGDYKGELVLQEIEVIISDKVAEDLLYRALMERMISSQEIDSTICVGTKKIIIEEGEK